MKLCTVTSIYIHGVSKKFSESYQKTNETKYTNKFSLLIFKIVAICYNTHLTTFIQLPETISKGLMWNRSQNGCHTIFDGIHVHKTCTFDGCFQVGKQEEFHRSQIREVRRWSSTATIFWARNWHTWTACVQGHYQLATVSLHCRSHAVHAVCRFSPRLWRTMCMHVHMRQVAIEIWHHSPNFLDTPCYIYIHEFSKVAMYFSACNMFIESLNDRLMLLHIIIWKTNITIGVAIFKEKNSILI